MWIEDTITVPAVPHFLLTLPFPLFRSEYGTANP